MAANVLIAGSTLKEVHLGQLYYRDQVDLKVAAMHKVYRTEPD